MHLEMYGWYEHQQGGLPLLPTDVRPDVPRQPTSKECPKPCPSTNVTNTLTHLAKEWSWSNLVQTWRGDTKFDRRGSWGVSDTRLLMEPDEIHISNSTRMSRNAAEKHRRDIINENISKMATLVPNVAESSRRMDKISILRLATAYLRTHYTLGRSGSNFLLPLKDQPGFDLEQFVVNELVDSEGFLLVVTATGKIVYVSQQVEQHLGHVRNELLGQSLYNYIHPDDHDELTRNLTPDGMQPISAPSSTGIAQVSEVHDNNSSSSEDSSTTSHRTNERTKRFREQRRHFKIRIAQRTHNSNKRDYMRYENFNISGLLRLAEACKNTGINANRGRQREAGTSNDIVFAGVATVKKQPESITRLSILDANKDEYVTRHLVDGRIIYCDHRVSVVAGYMSEEVSGLNAFAFMHKDDFRWTMIGLRQMYDRAETSGTSCYRLLTKTGKFIYLRTHGYLEFDKGTQTVESFVCINTLVSEDEGIRLIKQMKERFSATLSTNSRGLIRTTDINSPIELTLTSQASNPRCSLEDPSQLEDAITHLISDLPSPAISEGRFSPSLTPSPHMQYVKTATFSPRMSPAAAQTNKIGANKIDRCVVQGKGKVTPKQESKHTIGKLVNPSSTEQSPISDSESAMPTGKPLSMLEMMNVAHSSHNNVQNTNISVQPKILIARKPSKSSRASRNHTSCLDVSQNANVLNAQKKIDQRNVGMLSPDALSEGTTRNIKVERGIEETFNCPEKQYFDDSASDSSIVSSRIEMHSRCPLKRICSDENLLALHSKKRPDHVYASTNASNEQRVSYLKCKSFAAEYPTFSDEFNQYNDVNLQPLTTVESPNSSLHDVGTDYQQLIDSAGPLGAITNNDEQQFIAGLQDLKEHTLLSSELDAKLDDSVSNEIMMKLFDGLRNGSAGFENFNDTTLQQLSPDDQVNDELNRTYYQLADNMAMHESQINVLARDLKNPGLRTQRENLSQLQAEHNIQKQMLKNLRQDHCKVNAKQKLGI